MNNLEHVYLPAGIRFRMKNIISSCIVINYGPVYMEVATQIGEVTCGGSPHLSCKRHQIKMRAYMDMQVTPPKQVTSPTWGPTAPKQALRPKVSRSNQ